MEFRLCPGAPPPACGAGEARPHLSLSRCDNSRGGTRAERRAVAACMPGVHAARGMGPAPLMNLFLSRALRRAPERRCSSRTFRYGYLVTT